MTPRIGLLRIRGIRMLHLASWSLLLLIGMLCTSMMKKDQQEVQGLERIIVERFYEACEDDFEEQKNRCLAVPEGSVTYRIYADLAEDFAIQAVYGDEDNPIRISSDLPFFNSPFGGKEKGEDLSISDMIHNTAALDSWITMNAISDDYLAVLLEEDTDGNIIAPGSGEKKIGQYKKVLSGCKANTDPSDGMVRGTAADIVAFGFDGNIFRYNKSKTENAFYCDNCAWSTLGGTTGPTRENRVLIAQLTTAGSLSFELNIQVGRTDGQLVQQFVANAPSPTQFSIPSLKQ